MNYSKIVLYAADEIEREYCQMAIRRKCVIIAICMCLMSLEEVSRD